MRVLVWFGRCSWHLAVVALALSLAATLPNSAYGAQGGSIATAIKQAVPKAGAQLVKGAKLALACGAAACMFGVASPAAQAEQLPPSGVAPAAPMETAVPFIPFTGSWYAGTGVYTDSFGDFATFDVGFKGKGNFRWPGIKDGKGSADLFFLTSFHFKPDEVDTLDAAQVLPVTYTFGNVLLQGKLESSLGLGDIAGVDLGGVRQDRIAAVLDAVPGMGGAEVSNSLYHEGSARLAAILAQGRYVFSVNALHGTTINGLIEANDSDVGDFKISNDGIEVYGKIALIDNVAIEAFYGWYGQNVELTVGEQEIAAHESDGYLGSAVISWNLD